MSFFKEFFGEGKSKEYVSIQVDEKGLYHVAVNSLPPKCVWVDSEDKPLIANYLSDPISIDREYKNPGKGVAVQFIPPELSQDKEGMTRLKITFWGVAEGKEEKTA